MEKIQGWNVSGKGTRDCSVSRRYFIRPILYRDWYGCLWHTNLAYDPKGRLIKTPERQIPVGSAYENFLFRLEDLPTSATKWKETFFKTPWLGHRKGHQDSYWWSVGYCRVYRGPPNWFRDSNIRQKVAWDEATSPANFVPDGLSFLPVERFVNTFGEKEFAMFEMARLFKWSPCHLSLKR